MSTVPETIAANYLGMRVLGIACITNMATGIAKERHTHEEVVKIAVNIQEECPKTKSEKSRKNLANAEKLRVSGIQTIQQRHSLRDEKTGIKQGFNSPYFFVQKIFKKLKA